MKSQSSLFQIQKRPSTLLSIVRNVAKPGFDGVEFAAWCAEHGRVTLDDGNDYTLLMAPLNGFYSGLNGDNNPGKTQLRVSFCENPELLKLAPVIAI